MDYVTSNTVFNKKENDLSESVFFCLLLITYLSEAARCGDLTERPVGVAISDLLLQTQQCERKALNIYGRTLIWRCHDLKYKSSVPNTSARAVTTTKILVSVIFKKTLR